LAEYEKLLQDSFVLKDLNTFKHAPDFLDNPRLMNLYPQAVCDILEKLMFIGDQPKKKLSSTALREFRKRIGLKVLSDGGKVLRI
jgi:electron transfer flavoprotein-quinone oxidoreductase